MEKKGIIAIAVVAVVAIAVIGIVISSAINQDEHKAELQYYIDGNGGTSDGKTVVEWYSTNLPGNDVFTKDNSNYIVFNTQADGKGDSYWTNSACAAPKGSTLYVMWVNNYVSISGTMSDNSYDYYNLYENIDFKCGSETKHVTNTGNYVLQFDGTKAEPATPGVFGNYVEITIPDSASGVVTVDGNKITIDCADDATYIFELMSGAMMEKIDSAGQNKGIKLTNYSSMDNNCYFIKMNVTVNAYPPL